MKNKKLLVLLTTTILTNAWGSDSDFDSRGSTPDDSVPLNFGTNDANDYDPNNIFNPSLPQRHRVMRLNDWGDAVDAPHDSDLARAVAASLLDTTHDSNLASAIAASQRPRGRDVIPTELFQRAEAIGIEREVLLAMSAEEANALLAALRSDTTAVEAAPAQAASQHPIISEELRQLAEAVGIEEEYLLSLNATQARNLLTALQAPAEDVVVEFEADAEPVQDARQAAQIRAVREIVNTLQGINNGTDIHQIDANIEQNLPAVLQILSDNLGIAIPTDQNQVTTTLQSWSPPQFPYRRNNTTTSIGQARLATYIQRVIQTATENRDVFAAYDLAVQAITGMEGDQQTRHRNELLNAIAENYETRGECLQGVRTLIFIRLLDILCTVLAIRA